MEKISFLVADEVMKQAIERTLWTYYENFPNPDISTDITIIDFPRMEEQAREIIAKGYQLIITNSGSYQILMKTITEIPLLCLYSSTNDALYTIRQALPCKAVHLLLNKHFMFNLRDCPPEIRQKLRLYPPYSIDGNQHEVLDILKTIPIRPDEAIVGCTLLPQVAPNFPMTIYPIRPSESTILSVYQYANELLAFQRKDRHQLSLLRSILSHVDDGIILYDRKGSISHINRQARRFLNAAPTETKIQGIIPGLPEGEACGPIKEKLISSPPYTLLLNSSAFQLDKDEHFIATIRDVTELQRLEKNIRYKMAKTGLTAKYQFSHIRTVSPAMKQRIETARAIASYDAPVLIQGESGTGKELFAQSIHNASPRRSGPFVVVNCAALPPELLESELFGYVGGSFTGARKEGKAGYFELAHRGTIFLDEINSMSPNIQSKLLRVLESKEVMRIGSDYVIPLDIRIISASNADIYEAVRSGQFRRDLYFRLNTLTLNLPSLNDRPEDIVYLFSQFAAEFAGHEVPLPPALQEALKAHHWWGNIRELRSAALRYRILGDRDDGSYQYLFDTPSSAKPPLVDAQSLRIDMKALQHSVEVWVIEDLMRQGYTKSQIAQILSVSRQTVFNKLKDSSSSG